MANYESFEFTIGHKDKSGFSIFLLLTFSLSEALLIIQKICCIIQLSR